MKRKVVNTSRLKLSPNEEAFILKEDYERRRKLRLLQVREQERDIAFQIREDIKQRRSHQLTLLAEELRAQWAESQNQKIQNLEKLYLASLKSIGEGHRQAKENEPDLDALARRAAERRRRAETRHKAALKVQEHQKEALMRHKTWHVKARKEALLVEKERSAKITSLPPPPPAPFENIEVKRMSSVKTNSSTYHHISTFVSREMETKQPDAHWAADEEAKRLEERQKQAAQGRQEQLEKAHVRGSQAMRRIHAAQNQEKLMKELKQLQQEDLARKKQMVAQMPPQLLELPHQRSEMKEDWQRELEFAFEDMYNADRQVKGNLILHLEPEPLPTVTDPIRDEELDLSMEQDKAEETENIQTTEAAMRSSETDVPLTMKTQPAPSKILFKKLLNKIRSQKSLWTIKSMPEDENEMSATVSGRESKAPVVEAGAAASEEGMQSSEQGQVVEIESDLPTIESGPLSSEDQPLSGQTDSGTEKEISETPPVTAVAQSSVLLHPQEEAVRLRMSARQKQIMEIEEQKQKQLELLEQIEQQKLRLETDCFRAQLEEEKRKTVQQTGVGIVPASHVVVSDEDSHRQMIRSYQQQLLQQNRLHRQTVETARKRLLEYQTMLKGRYPSSSPASLIPDSTITVPPQRSEIPSAVSQHWDYSQRLNSSLSKDPMQISKLEQGHICVPRQNQFSQSQIETERISSPSLVLAKQSLDSKEYLRPFSQTEIQQRDYKLVSKDLHAFSSALSHDRPLALYDARRIPETFKTTAFQTLDSQEIVSENSENIPSKLTEPCSFLPLVPEHSFTLLPGKVKSGRIEEHFSTINKSTVSKTHSLISQMHDWPLPSSETITTQQGHLKALQEQLELQKGVLQARQEAQEQFLLLKQKELEEQTRLSVLFPEVAPDSMTLLPLAKAESGRIEEKFPPKHATAVSSGYLAVPQLQDSLLGFSQPILPQQNNLNLLQEQLTVRRDSFQARREAQEVLLAHRQSTLGRKVCSEQAEPSLPFQVAPHTFASLPFPDRQFGKTQEQHLSESDKELLSSKPEVPKFRDGSSSILRQFLPLHDSLKLLQEQVTAQSDALQAQHDAQVELLSHRQRDSGDSKSGQISSSFLPVFAQHSDDSQISANVEFGRFQKLGLSEKENIIPSSHLFFPTFHDGSLSFPQQENATAFQDQTHTQRVILGPGQETQEFAHKQSELEKLISLGQTNTCPSLPQVAEYKRLQEYMSITRNNTSPFGHFRVPGLQEKLLRFSQYIQPQQANLKSHQEWLDTKKQAFPFSQETQENSSSEQTGLSSFIPQLRQSSFTSLPSVKSVAVQEPLPMESDNRILSKHCEISELQDRLAKMSQLIQPQQDNLKALQEQLAIQREAIMQSRQEAQEKILLRKQNGWKERAPSQQVGTPSSCIGTQHPFAPLLRAEVERSQEVCPSDSDISVSSSHSEMQRLPDRLLGLSQPVLPQQDSTPALDEHLRTQIDPMPSTEKSQKELVFPKQYQSEEKISFEHLTHSHHGDIKTPQKLLDVQRKAVQPGQEVQELPLQELSKSEQRVSSEQINSSFSFQVVLPSAHSERTGMSFPHQSDHTETPRSQVMPVSISQPVLLQQGSFIAQLDSEREVVYSNEKPPEEVFLNKHEKLGTGESAEEHAVSPLSLSKETEHSFIPLPFGDTKSKDVCDLYSSKNEQAATSHDSVISRFQVRPLSYSQPILAQQDNIGLKKQLDLQREALYYSQKAQEELLLQRQAALQQQIERHQETLKDFFKDKQASKPTGQKDLKTQKMEQLREWLPLMQEQVIAGEENAGHTERSNSDSNQLHSEDVSDQQSGERLYRGPAKKASKPPVARVKCGLDLNQHELSAIQEVESPASGRTSLLVRSDFYQDRDPLRVSISREQSLLGSPLPCDPCDELQPAAQEAVCGEDSDAAVKGQECDVENHAVLSYTAEGEPACLSPAVGPAEKAETQTSHEPLSSITVSSGSFLSYEDTDLSLTDPEPLSEHMDHREQESATSKEGKTEILCSVVPPTQVIDQQQNSSDIPKCILPAVEEFTSSHTHRQRVTDKSINEADLTPEKIDLWELEYIFPNLHRQLFKPLEPHPDFDSSSSSSGISQDNRDFYQSSGSSSERYCVTALPRSRLSYTAPTKAHIPSLRTSPSQQLDPDVANTAAKSFAIETTEGCERSFQQLLPELSSQEESQHADLPSILSIEARDFSQCMENQNLPSEEQTEIFQNKKKSVHFQLSIGSLSSMCRACDKTSAFDQFHVQHSTPCSSMSSEWSVKQLESREERLGFEELSKGDAQSEGFTDKNTESCGGLAVNPHVEEIDSQLCVRTVEMGISYATPQSLCVQNGNSCENSRETSQVIQNPSQPALSEPLVSSGSFSLLNSVPVWETESGHGIMEEPELTLASTSDISTAEMELANLTLEEKSEHEANSCSQEIFPNCAAVTESLQEAFMKRKKSFIEQSCQRQKEIQSKTRVSKLSAAETLFSGGLKGVNKKSMSLPEERKMAQALMRKRALRLYNQLNEVKQQKEEKAKQEAYAQNRARAKEFHKKTLEKLRARNT
ncbi:centrosomal protein of 295 kDa [Ctenodactylus gundi]